MQAATELRQQALPLIAHVIYRLDFGGLENGLVHLINGITGYRHAVVCIDDFSDFGKRIKRDDVKVYALKKKEGIDLTVYGKLYRLFRELRPAIVHSRNLAGLDGLVPAFAARVPVRIHGEHGRDVNDLDGKRPRYRYLRRMFKPFVHHYIALSRDLERYLQGPVGVSGDRISQIYNGVNHELFRPRAQGEARKKCFAESDVLVVGTVGRMKEVKDPLALVRAFIWSLQNIAQAKDRLRLVMVGDGPLLQPARALLDEAGFSRFAWLPGARDDVHEILRELDVFVLPSLAEGISNTILEAMACGVPVVATDVGGNPELVQEGVTGRLVPRRDVGALSHAIGVYLSNAEMRMRHGAEARRIAETRFSLRAMVDAYLQVYDRLLRERVHEIQAVA
jgi:sugar transferase (PEP-CTERM/EpsH1 system associated)